MKYRISFGIREVTPWWKRKELKGVLVKTFESDKLAFELQTEIARKIDEIFKKE